MQKETLMAILIGLALGLLVTVGVYQLKVRHREKQIVKTEETISQPTNAPTPQTEDRVKIESPVDGLVTKADKIRVQGQFQPESYLVEVVNGTAYIRKQTTPEFEFTASLDLGLNTISVTGIDSNGQTYHQTRLVLREPIEPTPSLPEATPSSQASESAELNSMSAENEEATTEAILARINKKLGKETEVDQTRRVLVGSIERVTEESISLTNDQGTFSLPVKDSQSLTLDGQTVTVNKVAVGNWVVAVGEVEEATTRLTPTTKFMPEQIQCYKQSPLTQEPVILMGAVQSVDKHKLDLITRANNETKTVYYTNKLDLTDAGGHQVKIQALETDFNLIVVADEDKQGKLTAKQIKVLAELNPKQDEL